VCRRERKSRRPAIEVLGRLQADHHIFKGPAAVRDQ